MEETTTVLPEQSSAFRGVVIPHHLRTDELCAIVVFKHREQERLELETPPPVDTKFWGHPECPSDKMGEFLTQGFLPIEIGDLSYRKVKRANGEAAGSATEALVLTLGYDPAGLSTGEIKLMEILARRNSNGYMNQFYMSLPKILKDVYTLPGYEELGVMMLYMDIARAYIDYENRPEDAARTEIPAELNDLAKATERCQLAPFTPGRYLRDLCYRGEPIEHIRAKVLFWIRAVDDCRQEYLKARDEWPKMNKFKFLMEGMRAAAVETANPFFSKVAFNQDDQAVGVGFGLVIIRNPESGHTAIMTRRKNVSALHAKLERLEPGRWYHHQSAGNIINGGQMYPEVTPTGLPVEKLAGLVSKFPPR